MSALTPTSAGLDIVSSVPPSGLSLYREAFARRSAAAATSDQTVLDRPGVCGALGSLEHPGGRVLITDDRAAPMLETLLPDLHAQIVNVFSDAERCRELVEREARWQGEPATAMICSDLGRLPDPPIPVGLSMHAVARTAGDAADGVPLAEAARACLRADPQTADFPLAGFLEFLRSLPSRSRLLAAVDDEGSVRATAGASAFGSDANAYFVSTDAGWRGRGVATAMTAAALGWARDAGATLASLDASPAGLSIYLRLGFEPVAPTTLFARFG